MTILLTTILITLIFSAFFSGMEIAYISSNKLQIEIHKNKKNLNAWLYNIFTNNESLYIATMLIGNNIALVIYGISMSELIEPYLKQFTQNDVSILLLQTLISTIIILLTAEFLPKSVFRSNPNAALEIFALPVGIFMLIFYPISKITTMLSILFVRVFFRIRIQSSDETAAFGKIDLDHFVEQHNTPDTKEDSIDNEIKIFQNALDFSTIKVRECMIPRTEIEAIEVNKSIEELKEKFTSTLYSRILVYEDTIDNIIGYFHHSELFKKPKSIKEKISPLIIVPETMNAKKMLNKFIQQHKSMALVVDEFGGTSGVITLEDIMEEIFGEIEDEHDEQEFVEKQLSENRYLFSARLEIDYLNEEYDLKLPESDDYETIAGLIVVNLGYIPAQGETYQVGPYKFVINAASSSRIELVELEIMS